MGGAERILSLSGGFDLGIRINANGFDNKTVLVGRTGMPTIYRHDVMCAVLGMTRFGRKS